MLIVASVNVNGIWAAFRRGMGAWLDERRPDILCLQEVRAPDAVLSELLGSGWHGVHEEASAKGRAGVAVLARTPPVAVRRGLGDAPGAEEFAGTGRWVEADFTVQEPPGLLTVASVYVHKGETGTARQQEKYRFLDAVRARMVERAADGGHLLVGGDVNIAHREADLKNWKGNANHAGFLPQERAWFDRLLGADGFVDVQRSLAGEGPGPYSWWSWRGKAFDADAGWRIDYLIGDARTAERALKARIDRADTYAGRWSDHAAVVVDLDLILRHP